MRGEESHLENVTDPQNGHAPAKPRPIRAPGCVQCRARVKVFPCKSREMTAKGNLEERKLLQFFWFTVRHIPCVGRKD